MATVQIAWDYKCLGEDGGDYEWNLKLVRTRPLPEKTVALGSGTTERGDKTTRLAPGEYLPKSDPYFCETSRGQGYDKPEIGGPFTVPDYCAWTVSRRYAGSSSTSTGRRSRPRGRARRWREATWS